MPITRRMPRREAIALLRQIERAEAKAEAVSPNLYCHACQREFRNPAGHYCHKAHRFVAREPWLDRVGEED